MGKEITFDKFIRWAGVTLIVLAVLYMTNYLSSVLLPFFIAMGTAIAVIGGVLWLIIPPMIDQFDKLGEVLTRWLHQTTHTNNLTALIKDWLQANQEQIEHFLKSKDFSDAIKTTMPKVFSVVSQTATVLMSIVASMITLLYMFFILLDYETLTANWVRIFPKKNRPFWSALMKDVERELNNYIRGQGHHVLHRFYHHRFPDGDRSGHSHRHHGPGSVSPYLRPHPYGIPCHAEGCRYRSELLAGIRSGCSGVLCGAGHHRHGSYPEDYG